ncbi:hypothetical protein [uncultured Cytophaga sp.]|uniref:hypothetical protein n=1 Tax=uncultured Cytophaga sp. TaxID=160238 RepID=UPI00261BBD50|nr:hypothetical protein [uncultured Cytophaga sp.]
MKELKIRAHFKHDPLTVKVFTEKAEAYLKLLQRIQPKFADFLILQTGLEKTPIKADYSNFKELFYKGCFDKDWAYTNLDKHGNGTDESTGDFMVWISNRKRQTDDQFLIKFSINNDDLKNNHSTVQIDLPVNEDVFFDWKFCSELLKVTAAFWNAEFASIYTLDFARKVVGKNTSFDIGWINYFPNQDILGLITIKDVDSIVQTNLGQCIVTITESMPDDNNPEYVDKAIKFRDKITPHGLLNWKQE